MGKTKIQWTRGDDGSLGETWNPTRGCTKISPGCKHCYASTFAERFRGVPGHPYEQGFDLRLVPDKLDAPLHWKKPRRVFVNSMSDLFHEDVPDSFLDSAFAVMALASQHTYQVLTKRAERMSAYMAGLTLARLESAARTLGYSLHFEGRPLVALPLPSVWLGVSVENQECADERIPHLLRTPAAVRFLSCEPLIESVTLGEVALRGAFLRCEGETDDPATDECNGCPGYTGRGGDYCGAVRGPHVDWVIVGGESGHGARPFDLAWARSILAQCKAAQVPVFLKQVGARPVFEKTVRVERRGTVDAERQLVSLHIRDRHGGDPERWPSDLRVRQFPKEQR